MCDFLPGRLLVSHHRNDIAARAVIGDIREDKIQHVSYIEDMEARLAQRDLQMPEGFDFEFHLLRVPDGEEVWKINYIRFFYQGTLLGLLDSGKLPENMWSIVGDSGSHMLVAPDSTLSLCQSGSSFQFQFDAMHGTYKQLLGLPHPGGSTGRGTITAILDTGFATQTGVTLEHGSRNFHDETDKFDIDDINGHGTVVTSIAHDVAPGSGLLVFKVGDGNPISEWNVLAALFAAKDADIINLSLAFGMPYRNCHVCGRSQSHSSRSAIFELVVDQLLRVRPDTIIVAAAGNRQQNALDFPARFSQVVAVGAIDSNGNRPSYSNYGATDHLGHAHELLFFAPGGGNGEFVAATGAPRRVEHKGTSFAAPYVSGLVALYHGQPHANRDRANVLAHFKAGASQNLHGYSVADFGKGLGSGLITSNRRWRRGRRRRRS